MRVSVVKVLAEGPPHGEFYYMVRVDERLVAALSTCEAWELLAQLANAMHQEEAPPAVVVQVQAMVAAR